MYTLKAISDSHPSNKMLNLLSNYEFKKEFLEEVVGNIINSSKNNVKCVTEKAFWEKCAVKLVSAVYEEWNKINLPERIRKISPPERSIRVKLERIRKIHELQFLELDKGYSLLYHEGSDPDSIPLVLYAQNKGIETIFLDKNNPAYNLYFNNDRFDELIQILRESFWVKRIKPSSEINNSLLVAGRNHIDNKYGLTTELKKKQIKLISILDCEQID